MSITDRQRDQIRNLHEAYRAALSNLDWSVGEDGHSADTMERARELRLALRAEIIDVLHRDRSSSSAGADTTCPYSGKKTPVAVGDDAGTLYL